MVSVGARHTGELGFESLLRHFFKYLTQHLALPESPAGQTVPHPPLYVHKPVVDSFENLWTIRKVVHPCWTICLVDNPQVGKTTMNRWNCFTKPYCWQWGRRRSLPRLLSNFSPVYTTPSNKWMPGLKRNLGNIWNTFQRYMYMLEAFPNIGSLSNVSIKFISCLEKPDYQTYKG